MDFAYRYRELLLGTLRFIPKDFQDKIQSVMAEEDQEKDLMAEAILIAEKRVEYPDLERLLRDLREAEQAWESARSSTAFYSITESISMDQNFFRAHARYSEARNAYEAAIKKSVGIE